MRLVLELCMFGLATTALACCIARSPSCIVLSLRVNRPAPPPFGHGRGAGLFISDVFVRY